MHSRLRSLAFTGIVAVCLAACAQQAAAIPPPTPGPSAVEDLTGLSAALEAAGAEIEPGEAIEQPFFSVAGQIMRVNGADVQVFEYETAEAMANEAEQVSADGSSIGPNMVNWMAPPHFFRSGRMIVLYVGEDEAILSLLQAALGEPFAGR